MNITVVKIVGYMKLKKLSKHMNVEKYGIWILTC